MPPVVPLTSVTDAAGGDAQPAADAEPPRSLFIDIVHESGDWASVAGADDLVLAAGAALEVELELAASEACVALSDDSAVAELNASYRGKAAPTNVLSFPAGHTIPIEEDEPRFLGDVVLALETLQREAHDLDLPLAHHLQHLVVHGLLHLLGHDHLTDEEARTMESLEVRILARLGIADPYAAADAPHGSVEDPTPHTKP